MSFLPTNSEPVPSSPGIAPPAPPRFTGAQKIVVVLVYAAVTLILLGGSLRDGSVMDDHWHQKGLREDGWSMPELLKSLVIEPADFMHTWWQDKPVRWEYGRPFFILEMKLVYHVLGHDNPIALHALSLLLHVVNACLVCRLCLLLTGSRFWSAFGGLLFVVYPHAVVTVSWPSAQNAVLAATLMLGSLLLYIRASRLRMPAMRQPVANAAAMNEAPPLSAGAFAGCLGLWILALETRENALMMPAFFLAFDFAFGGRAQLRSRMRAYLLLAAIGAAFVVWRVSVITHPMPDVYCRRPDGDHLGYGLWCAAKLLHYVCASIWPAPMLIGPTGRIDPWSEVPGDCILMLVIVAILTIGYVALNRRVAGWWIWPAWIVLSVLPVVPVVATSHSGYLGGIGFAVAVVLAIGTREKSAARLTSAGRPARIGSRLGFHVARGAALSLLALTAFFSVFHRLQWVGVVTAERYVYDCVAAAPPPPGTTDVYFLNLPFVCVYSKPALDRLIGPSFRDVRCHVLTYAPSVLGMEDRSIVRVLDEHRLSIEIEDDRYFSGFLGRFLLEGFRRDGRLLANETFEADGFRATVAEADESGVRRIVFDFDRPLSDSRQMFYLSSPRMGAIPIPAGAGRSIKSPASVDSELPTTEQTASAGRRLLDGDASAAEALFAMIRSGTPEVRREASDVLRPVVAEVTAATASPMQSVMGYYGPPARTGFLARIRRKGGARRLVPRPPSMQAGAAPTDELSIDDWRDVEAWWESQIDDQMLRCILKCRDAYLERVESLEEPEHGRDWMSLIVRSDLYLTGPPFPGPRRLTVGRAASSR